MKRAVEELAIFGGTPLFDSIKPVGHLAVPPLDAYLERLRPIFHEHRLSGNGPVVAELERRLAEYHGVSHCIAVANACVGLVMVLRQLVGGKRGNAIVPAFSYSGIPHIVQWAGQMPKFCDVERRRHGLDPVAVDRAIDEDTTVILAVANVHGTCEIDALQEIASRRKVPIVFDSVSALGASFGGKMLGSFGRAEVFSLHATKMLNGFEGGYITTNDDALAQVLRDQRNSGVVNARLNEMHAALALLCVDQLDDVIGRNEARYRAYERELASVEGLELLRYVDEAREHYTYQMAFVAVTDRWPLTREDTVKVLRAERAFAMPYYSPALHHSSHCPIGVAVPELPVAEELARLFMYLPGGEHTTIDDVASCGELLRFVHEHGDEIRRRLSENAA